MQGSGGGNSGKVVKDVNMSVFARILSISSKEKSYTYINPRRF